MARRNTSGRAGWLIGGLGFGVAAGVALGTLVIAPNMPDGPDPAPAREDTETTERAEIAEAQAASADSVIADLAGSAVADTLTDRPVLVIRTADAVEEDVAGVQSLLADASAIDAGTITLSESFLNADGADQLKSIVANTLPAGAQLSEDRLDPGVHAGEALGSALLLDAESGDEQASSEERALLLRALREAELLDYEDGTILPAQVIVVVTGDSAEGLASRTLADFVEALDGRGNGAVLAGRIHTAADTGAVGLVRAGETGVSTIDSVDRAVGRMATVLAVREQLEGESGAYGSAESAEAASPAP